MVVRDVTPVAPRGFARSTLRFAALGTAICIEWAGIATAAMGALLVGTGALMAAFGRRLAREVR